MCSVTFCPCEERMLQQVRVLEVNLGGVLLHSVHCWIQVLLHGTWMGGREGGREGEREIEGLRGMSGVVVIEGYCFRLHYTPKSQL